MTASVHSINLSSLLTECEMTEDELEEEVTERDYNDISSILVGWEFLAYKVGFKDAEVNDIKTENSERVSMSLQFLKNLKRRLSFNANYLLLVENLLHIGRAEEAKQICLLAKKIREVPDNMQFATAEELGEDSVMDSCNPRPGKKHRQSSIDDSTSHEVQKRRYKMGSPHEELTSENNLQLEHKFRMFLRDISVILEEKINLDKFKEEARRYNISIQNTEKVMDIDGYLAQAFNEMVITPLHESSLVKLVYFLIGHNIKMIDLWEAYKLDKNGFMAAKNILDLLKSKDRKYLLKRRPQSEKEKGHFQIENEDERNELTAKVNVPIKKQTLLNVQELWDFFKEVFDLQPLTALLVDIQELCIEITWNITNDVALIISDKAPLMQRYFSSINIKTVWINGECIFREEIHAARNKDKAEQHLLKACEDGKNLEVKSILKVPDVNINVQSQEGKTPLILAAMKGHLNIVNTLLSNRVLINFKEATKGWNALFYAAYWRNEPIVKILLQNGADILITDKDGSSLLDIIEDLPDNSVIYEFLSEATMMYLSLLDACSNEDMQLFQFFASECNLNTKTANIVNGDGETLLMLATKHGCKDIVQYILSLKPDVNIQESKQGRTALFYATENGDLAIAEMLLHQGADVLIRDNDGATVLDILTDNSKIFIPICEATLISAARCGDLKLVKKMISDIQTKINAIEMNDEHYTALMWACSEGHNDVVNFLLSHKADPNIESASNWTSLLLASRNHHTSIAKQLLQKEINLDKQNSKGWTALLFAASNGNRELAELLLQKGAKCDLADKNGFTPLVQASQKGHYEIVELLVDGCYDVDINHKTTYPANWTAVMQATKNGHYKVVQYLTEKGSNIYGEKNKVSVLHIASYKGHANLVDFFCQNKVDINYPNEIGLTPLMHAAKQGHLEVVKVLLKNSADVNLPETNIKWTAPFFALSARDQKVFEYIVQKGKVDFQHKDVKGNTLSQLSLKIKPEAFLYLRKNGFIKSEDLKLLQEEKPKTFEERRAELQYIPPNYLPEAVTAGSA